VLNDIIIVKEKNEKEVLNDMITVKEMEEVVKEHEKKLSVLEENGCDALSKKYLEATNKFIEQKTILEKLKKERAYHEKRSRIDRS